MSLVLNIYSAEVIIKSNPKVLDKTVLHNYIRAIEGVVVLTAIKDDLLDNRTTEIVEWSLCRIKFISIGNHLEDLENIRQKLLTGKSIGNNENNITGIYQFIVRTPTIKKVKK